MPLIILGLLLLIGLLAYSIVRYMNSGEEDTRSVRERYPHIFQPRDKADDAESDSDDPIHAEGYVDTDNLRGDIDYMLRNLKENVKEKAREHGIDLDKFGRDPLDHDPYGRNKHKKEEQAEDKAADKDNDDPIIFPTDNVEVEKNKRGIH